MRLQPEKQTINVLYENVNDEMILTNKRILILTEKRLIRKGVILAADFDLTDLRTINTKKTF